jgi:hypothetical protein
MPVFFHLAATLNASCSVGVIAVALALLPTVMS